MCIEKSGGSWFLIFDFWFLIFDFWFLIFDFWFLIFIFFLFLIFGYIPLDIVHFEYASELLLDEGRSTLVYCSSIVPTRVVCNISVLQ